MKDQNRPDSLKDLKNHENVYDGGDDTSTMGFVLGMMCLGMITFGIVILLHSYFSREEIGLSSGTYSIPMLKRQ